MWGALEPLCGAGTRSVPPEEQQIELVLITKLSHEQPQQQIFIPTLVQILSEKEFTL